MPYDQRKHHRRSIRLPGYDYRSPGAYFVTLCVHGGECLLGEVVDGVTALNDFGQIVHDFWRQVPVHFPRVSIDTFVVMPNHLHAIIVIRAEKRVGDAEKGGETPPLQDMANDAGRGAVVAPPIVAPSIANDAGRGAVAAPSVAAPPIVPPPAVQSQIQKPSLGQIVAYYKYQTTKRINELRTMPGVPFWQRNYWEHVIRYQRSLNRIRAYIENNPARWAEDQLHPNAPPNRFNQWQPQGHRKSSSYET
jgi:REP element-mobilizing transposase RayT